MIWVMFALMTIAAVAAALWPLAFPRAGAPPASNETDFYRAQLSEIERDVERGVLPEAEASGARAETGRRLIAVASESDTARSATASSTRRWLAAAVGAAAIVVVGAGVYGRLGSPAAPDMPVASRPQEPAVEDQVAAAISHVEAETRSDPDNLKAWSALAPVYIRMGRYPDAVVAFQNVLRLKGEDGEIRADLGEAEVAAAQGKVTPEARADFEKALSLIPGSPMARFYLALADEQAGDTAKAAAVYEELIPATADRPQWQEIIKARLAKLKGEPAPDDNAPVASSAPAGEGVTQDQIGAMVARLANRLAEKGGSADEWTRLVRAYIVLKQTDKAQEALASARKALAADPAALANLDAMSKTLNAPEAAPAAPSGETGPPDMIGAMVARLAKRLADQGGSADEWTRLVRAYTVLKQTDKAQEALASAHKALAGDPAALANLDATAKSLGLTQPLAQP